MLSSVRALLNPRLSTGCSKRLRSGPEDIERLVIAYEQTLRALRLTDRNDPITQLATEKIIAIGRTGIEDLAEISELALKQLGPAGDNRIP
jgi:hypothetical protein